MVSCVLLTIPMFFSGIVFSTLIGKAKVNISTALAYNLMGALFGGLMEYNSMYFGFAVPVSAGDRVLFPGMGVFLGRGGGQAA